MKPERIQGFGYWWPSQEIPGKFLAEYSNFDCLNLWAIYKDGLYWLEGFGPDRISTETDDPQALLVMARLCE